MDSFERVLTLLLKELKEKGYFETFTEYAETAIQTGYGILAEIAVVFLSEIIGTCFSCFYSSFGQNNGKKQHNNPFVEIILKLIKQFLFDYETIVRFIKAVIELFGKLLRKFRSKQSSSQHMAIVAYQRIPVKSCKSCPCQAGTWGNSTPVTEETQRRANVGTSRTRTNINAQHSTNVGTSRTLTDISTQHRARVVTSSRPTDINTQLRENLGTSRTLTNISTQHGVNVGTSRTHTNINAQHSTNVGTSRTLTDISTQHRARVVTSSRPTDINTQLRENLGTSRTLTNISTQHGVNLGTSRTHTNINAQHSTNVGTRTLTDISTQHRARVVTSSRPTDINTQHSTNVGTSSTSTNIQLEVNLGTNNSHLNVNTQFRINVGTSSTPTNTNAPCRANIDSINLPERKSITESNAKGFVGTRKMNNSNFKGEERKICYYVGRVSLNTSGQDIIDYLKKTIPDGYFECVKLTSKGKMQSFKLIANLSVKEYLENPMNWPAEVRVRRWERKNKTATTPTQAV